MDDPAVVEESEAFADFAQEKRRLLNSQSGGLLIDQLSERRAGDVFHDDEGNAVGIVADVEDRDQVGAFEVHALADAAQLDLLVALDDFQRHFAAAVADGVINLAKSAASHAALDRVAIERTIAMFVSKCGHG